MLSDIQRLTDILAVDVAGILTPDNKSAAIELALSRYSSDRPRIAKQSYTFTNELLDLPENWMTGFSSVIEICLQSGGRVDFEIIDTLNGQKIDVKDGVPTGENIAISYTLPHILTETADTIPTIDREAVANWAAAFLLDSLAVNYAGALVSTVSSDSVQHGSKSGSFRNQAAVCRKFYRDHLGLDDKRNAAVGTTVVVKRLGTSGRSNIVQRRF